MMMAGYGRAAGSAGGGGAAALTALPLITAASFTTTPPVDIGPTIDGQEIRAVVIQGGTATATLTAPADWTILESTVVNNNKAWLSRWNGTGARPNNTSVVFTSTEERNSSGFSLVFNGLQGEGVHGATAGSSGSGQFTGPAGLTPSATGLVMHLWAKSGSPTLTMNAPTTGFGTAPPAAYPATEGLLAGDGTDFGVPHLPFYFHWGSYGGGAYVAPKATPSGFLRAGCISFEVLSA